MPTNPSHRNAVTDFGADPTGVGDSTTAINTALNYDGSTPPPPATPGGLGFQGLSVYLPAGTYRITGTLYINQSGTTLYGDGPGSTTIMMSYVYPPSPPPSPPPTTAFDDRPAHHQHRRHRVIPSR
jgi:hypothetical protein